MRLKQDLGRAKWSLDSATRNRIVGGVVLLIGTIALISYVLFGAPYTSVLAAAGLFIGGLVFIRALVKMGGAHRSIDTFADRVANAQAKLDGLEAQSPVAE